MRIKPGKKRDLCWGIATVMMSGIVVAGLAFKYGMYFEATHPTMHSFSQLEAYDPALVQMIVIICLGAGASIAVILYQIVELVGECVEWFGQDDQTRPIF